MIDTLKSLFGLAAGAGAGWLYAGVGLVVAGLVAWGGHALYAGGAASVQADWDKALAADAGARLERLAASAAIGDAIGADVALKLDEIHVQTITLIREVPKYVTPQIDARYPLPVGLERVWNASALGIDVSAIPLAAGQSDDSPSAARASDAAGAIAETHGNFRACRESLAGLIAFARAQHALSVKR